MILAKANRSGGKTMDFAVLDMLFAEANPKCEIANVAAIQAQTQRCYRYVQSFHELPAFKKHVISSLLSRTNYWNGASLELLTATVSGVNSPHPQKLIADEVELFNWFILQQAINMVKSKDAIKGQMIFGSTQKFVGGPMQRLIDQATAKGTMAFYEWCCMDVMKKPHPTQIPYYKEIFGDDLPENIGNADGFFDWEDLISTFRGLDREIWETEWLCKRPQSGGLVYPRFSDERNMIHDFVLQPDKVFLFEDCGYAIDHPDVVLFAQVDQVMQKVVIFDELYMSLKSTGQIIEEVKNKLQQYGLDFFKLRAWIVDPHMLTEQTDRFNLGAPVAGAENEWKVDNPPLLLLRNSIPVVRKFIDEGWLKLTPNCTNLRGEFMMYSKMKNPDGTYKDEPRKEYDHGPDATRYGLVKLFPAMAFASFQVTRETAETISQPQMEPPITAGILSMKF